MYISISDIKRDTIFYIIRNIIFYVLMCVILAAILKTGELKIYIKIIILILIFLISLSCLLYMKKYISYYLKDLYLRENGIRIEALFNKEEFNVAYNLLIYHYEFVAYFTENERTYIFHDDMIYGQPMLAINIEKIKEEGVIPDTISILVDPDDYNRYIILKYNFLNEMYELNEDIIDSCSYKY